MISMEYANAYTEVLEILKFIPKTDYNKIPQDMIKVFSDNQNKNKFFISSYRQAGITASY